MKMGRVLLCVLGFLSVSMIPCGRAEDPLLSIEPNWSTLFTGDSVTLTCDMREGADTDWWYGITRDGHEVVRFNADKSYTLQPLTAGNSGEYQCHCQHKRTGQEKTSNTVSLTVSDRDVILVYPASTLFEGESVTLRCRHRNQTKEKNVSFYRDRSLMDTNLQDTVEVTITSDRSSYSCSFEDKESEAIKLKMEAQPKASLSKGSERDNVILTCSVGSSSSSSFGWTFFWYRDKKTSEPLTRQGDRLLSSGQIRVSQRGMYWCRGGRGSLYTQYSNAVAVTNRAVVTVQPNWPEIYSGETVILTCHIEDGGDTEWEYEWTTPLTYRPQNPRGHMIRPSHGGDYSCYGRPKNGKISTEWSEDFTLEFKTKPKPVLTVTPSWLSPGASVTLTCSVEPPSAGWRFFWYKAVPTLMNNYYKYELLPGSTTGTEQDSYIVHGQMFTGGYKCQAARGDPVYLSDESDPKFIWSRDFHPAASLTVSPDRLQHFDGDSLSLSCEGNSTEWRVMRFSSSGWLSYCSLFGTMTGSTCNNDKDWLPGVYWCESETGQFSSAVNITKQYYGVILEIPARPVTSGLPVTLRCMSKTQKALHNVNFYKNGELILNDSRGELNIPVVSESDEGFYKCEAKHLPQGQSLKSEESWMSVKYAETAEPVESSGVPVLLIVGLVCGVSLIVLLLLLFLRLCRKSKDSSSIRTQSTNQVPAADHTYSSPHLVVAAVYDTVTVPEELNHDESEDVTYSQVELKNFATKNGKKKEPGASAVYSAADDVMYAQVFPQARADKGKGKKKKEEPEDGAVYSDLKVASAAGTSSAAADDQTLYSEVKPKSGK